MPQPTAGYPRPLAGALQPMTGHAQALPGAQARPAAPSGGTPGQGIYSANAGGPTGQMTFSLGPLGVPSGALGQGMISGQPGGPAPSSQPPLARPPGAQQLPMHLLGQQYSAGAYQQQLPGGFSQGIRPAGQATNMAQPMQAALRNQALTPGHLYPTQPGQEALKSGPAANTLPNGMVTAGAPGGVRPLTGAMQAPPPTGSYPVGPPLTRLAQTNAAAAQPLQAGPTMAGSAPQGLSGLLQSSIQPGIGRGVAPVPAVAIANAAPLPIPNKT
jgi:hypothetical protein